MKYVRKEAQKKKTSEKIILKKPLGYFRRGYFWGNFFLQIKPNEWLPTAVSKDRLLDANSIIYCTESITSLFDEIIENNQKIGAPLSDFIKLKDI